MNEYIVDLTGVATKSAKEADSAERLAMLWGLPVCEEIVRCSNCKHSFEEGSGYLYCGRRPGHCFETGSNGFCAWGVPKERQE